MQSVHQQFASEAVGGELVDIQISRSLKHDIHSKGRGVFLNGLSVETCCKKTPFTVFYAFFLPKIPIANIFLNLWHLFRLVF